MHTIPPTVYYPLIYISQEFNHELSTSCSLVLASSPWHNNVICVHVETVSPTCKQKKSSCATQNFRLSSSSSVVLVLSVGSSFFQVVPFEQLSSSSSQISIEVQSATVLQFLESNRSSKSSVSCTWLRMPGWGCQHRANAHVDDNTPVSTLVLFMQVLRLLAKNEFVYTAHKYTPHEISNMPCANYISVASQSSISVSKKPERCGLKHTSEKRFPSNMWRSITLFLINYSLLLFYTSYSHLDQAKSSGARSIFMSVLVLCMKHLQMSHFLWDIFIPLSKIL